MRDRLLVVLLVPVILLPILVIASGGDVEMIWRELWQIADHTFVVRVYAGVGSPPVMPSGPVMPGTPLPAGAPVLTNWSIISASIILALIALFSIRARAGHAAGK
jgi:hypothetical protein